MGPDYKAIKMATEEIERVGLYIEYKSNIDYYIGINIEEQDNSKINITQHQIIDRIINGVQIPKNTAPRQTTNLSTKILCCDAASPPFVKHFNY